MDKILYKKELLGIRIKKLSEGTHPITDGTGSLELVTLKNKKGHIVAPHKHKPMKRSTTGLQECIVVLKGKVRIDLFGNEQKVVKRIFLKQGEVFITISGGHSIHFLEDSQIIETKNGPFKKDRIAI